MLAAPSRTGVLATKGVLCPQCHVLVADRPSLRYLAKPFPVLVGRKTRKCAEQKPQHELIPLPLPAWHPRLDLLVQ